MPVLLSMFVLAFTDRLTDVPLPASRLDLYRLAAQAAVRRHHQTVVQPDGSTTIATTTSDAATILSMLSHVAVTAQTSQQREFGDGLVKSALV